MLPRGEIVPNILFRGGECAKDSLKGENVPDIFFRGENMPNILSRGENVLKM